MSTFNINTKLRSKLWQRLHQHEVIFKTYFRSNFFNVLLLLQNLDNDLKFREQSKLLKQKWRASTVEERMVIISVTVVFIRICFFFCLLYNRLINYYHAKMVLMARAYSRHWGHGCVFWGTFLEKKKTFCLLSSPKQIPFLTISNDLLIVS